MRRQFAILSVVLTLVPLLLAPATGRAELPVRQYDMIGTDLVALSNATDEFHRRLPDRDVRDFDIWVWVYENELVITFAHKDRPLGIVGQDPEYPILSVHLSPDGTDVLKSHFAR